jgi:hypothetical protein
MSYYKQNGYSPMSNQGIIKKFASSFNNGQITALGRQKKQKAVVRPKRAGSFARRKRPNKVEATMETVLAENIQSGVKMLG